MSEQRFQTTPRKEGKGARILLPFSPDTAWGQKERHHITGSVGGYKIRGPLKAEGERFFLALGPAWMRDNPLPDSEIEVILRPEGPQEATMAADLAAALDAEPDAKAFFASLATFYRKGYVNWIESAKRPNTRAARIEETVSLLKAGRKQR